VRYHQEGDNFFLDQIAIGSETWVSHRPWELISWVVSFSFTVKYHKIQTDVNPEIISHNTRCDNLILGMAVACRWGVESGKLMYPITFGHVPTCVYVSHRPNESFVPKQQRK
jgi:hypothetical protein